MANDDTTARTALVTGGNRGIGLAIARALAADGVRVVVGSRSGQAPDGLAAVPLDVTDSASVDAAFDAAEQLLGGPVEILVANAGVTRDQLLMRLSDEEIDAVVQTNLVGAIRCARRASRGMIRLKRGRMIFISSVVGLNGSPGQVGYAATKAALVGVARSITRELGGRRITANVVAPGFIDTDMTAELGEDLRTTYRSQIPAGRFGDPADVAAVGHELVDRQCDHLGRDRLAIFGDAVDIDHQLAGGAVQSGQADAVAQPAAGRRNIVGVEGIAGHQTGLAAAFARKRAGLAGPEGKGTERQRHFVTAAACAPVMPPAPGTGHDRAEQRPFRGWRCAGRDGCV